jgi:ATP adenylyltransferase
MKRLWAPWRMKYIQSNPRGCVFCNVQEHPGEAESLIIFRARHAFVILNLYPYTSGHLLVVANRHVASLEDLEPDERAEMMELATRAMRVLRRVYKPEGFNLGANIGKSAGAGIPGHIHLHVVPRWGGDANFLSTAAETRVLPEDLSETGRRVRAEWEKE